MNILVPLSPIPVAEVGPLYDGRAAHIAIPDDITQADVDRIHQLLLTLPFEDLAGRSRQPQRAPLTTIHQHEALMSALGMAHRYLLAWKSARRRADRLRSGR